ncbi:MAG TPA: hypothetical protein VFS60_16670 [Thermoanaerobaculia bacterium]|nr:hypothetical protein [Thermoanaerobaculia bacterium]
MKKLIVGAVLALAVAAFLPRAASAGIWENGIWENGIWENGVWSNGTNLQGISLNGFKGDGFELDGQRPAGPQCTERGVDFSAVPLAKVTVRLPQPAR